jgi:AcrR family transcriptional regulator
MPKDAKELRTQIIVAAIDCFAAHGVGETTMTEIAKKAKIAPALLKYHFQDFSKLFYSVVEFIREDLRRALAKSENAHPDHPIKALEEYTKATIDYGKTQPKYAMIWIYMYHAASHQKLFRELNGVGRKTGRQRISLLLYRALELKMIDPPGNLKVPELCLSIQALIAGYSLNSITEPDVDFEQLKKLAVANLRQLIGFVGKA